MAGPTQTVVPGTSGDAFAYMYPPHPARGFDPAGGGLEGGFKTSKAAHLADLVEKVYTSSKTVLPGG